MNPRRVAVAALVAFAAGCGAGGGRDAGLRAGAAAPAVWRAAPGRVVVGWAVRPEQLVACETAAYQLRALRARFGADVALSIVTVDPESALVHAFLRAQRLSGVPVSVLDETAFRTVAGARAEPTLFVVRDGRVRGRLPAGRDALLDPAGARRLELLVRSLLAAGPEAPLRPPPRSVRPT